MRRLTLRQILVAIAIGALFALLQGDPALKKLAAVTCLAEVTHC